jgi:hypothetical protein
MMRLRDDIQRGILAALGTGLVFTGQPVGVVGGLVLVALAWRPLR